LIAIVALFKLLCLKKGTELNLVRIMHGKAQDSITCSLNITLT